MPDPSALAAWSTEQLVAELAARSRPVVVHETVALALSLPPTMRVIRFVGDDGPIVEEVYSSIAGNLRMLAHWRCLDRDVDG